MIDSTTLLFALPGFRVLNVTLDPDGGRVVLVESVAVEGGCPSCGVMSSPVKDHPVCRLKDLPMAVCRFTCGSVSAASYVATSVARGCRSPKSVTRPRPGLG
jgi:hypothetical protein